MKALLCSEFTGLDALRVEDVASPVPNKGQVVITVKAAGVNFPDTLIVAGKYQIKPPLPFAPGGEFAGVVREVGEGVTSVNVGERVLGVSL